MKQYAQQILSLLLSAVMIGVTAFGLNTAAGAAGLSGNALTDMEPQAGTTPGAHMSTTGSADSNAQRKHGATQGAERAPDRTSPAEMRHAPRIDATGQATLRDIH